MKYISFKNILLVANEINKIKSPVLHYLISELNILFGLALFTYWVSYYLVTRLNGRFGN